MIKIVLIISFLLLYACNIPNNLLVYDPMGAYFLDFDGDISKFFADNNIKNWKALPYKEGMSLEGYKIILNLGLNPLSNAKSIIFQNIYDNSSFQDALRSIESDLIALEAQNIISIGRPLEIPSFYIEYNEEINLKSIKELSGFPEIKYIFLLVAGDVQSLYNNLKILYPEALFIMNFSEGLESDNVFARIEWDWEKIFIEALRSNQKEINPLFRVKK